MDGLHKRLYGVEQFPQRSACWAPVWVRVRVCVGACVFFFFSIFIGMQICLNREYAVEAAKNPKGPQVSRSRVARLLKLLRMKSLGTQVSEVKLTAYEQEQLKSAFVTEILALREGYYTPLSLMFNMDETAYQITPPPFRKIGAAPMGSHTPTRRRTRGSFAAIRSRRYCAAFRLVGVPATTD